MVKRIILGIVLLVTLSSQLSAQSGDATREFLAGHRTTFSTKGHPKAGGVDLSIAYPNSWAAAEGERPHIVQKFVSEGGHGLESVMIIAQELPLPPGTVITEQEQKDLFSPSELRDMLPAGATIVDAQSTQSEGAPAGIMEYTMRVDRLGMVVLVHAWTLNFLSGNTLVQVQCQVTGLAEAEEEVSRRMAASRPLFGLMANSIVCPDKWTAAPPVSAGSLDSPSSPSLLLDSDPALLIWTLVVSFVLTWGLGLTPPLLIRYAFVRRPLSKKAASWVAAGFSAFFWMGFRLFSAALGERPGTGFVWIIVFFVARWIMSRGYVRPVADLAARGQHQKG